MTVLISNENINLKNKINLILDSFVNHFDVSRGIFLKPNIVFPVKDRSGEITRLAVVKTLIKCLRERFPNIDIVIGEGVAAGCNPEKNFQVSGYEKLARELNVPLLDLNKAPRKKLQWEFGPLTLPSDALERFYINLPILKHSSACIISGALKNQKGLLIPNMKKQFHRWGLHDQIAALNQFIQPGLTILDGSNFFGRDVLITGNNTGEIDMTVCKLLGIDEPDHVRLARKRNVFSADFKVIGDSDKIKNKGTRPMAKEYKQIGRLRLWSNPQACTMCRYIFQDVQRNILRLQNFKAALKLFKYSIKGAEIIWGKNPNWERKYKTVICLGACTRQLAKDEDFIFIPGCSPTVNELTKHLP